MDFRPVERDPGAFQQSVTADEIQLLCRAAFGAHVRVVSAVELGLGLYNSTYRVDIGRDRPVILRVAPEPARQSRDERELMRNEHATVPYLASIASLLPTTLAIDFTHEVIPRDWMFQTLLSGPPGRTSSYAIPSRSRRLSTVSSGRSRGGCTAFVVTGSGRSPAPGSRRGATRCSPR